METIKTEDTTNSIFEAIDEDKYLILGDNIFVDGYNLDMDAIFANVGAWKRFANKVDAEGVDFLIRRKYIDTAELKKIKYCIKIGEGKYIEVEYKDLNFSFNYEWYTTQNNKLDICDLLEIYVNVSIR